MDEDKRSDHGAPDHPARKTEMSVVPREKIQPSLYRISEAALRSRSLTDLFRTIHEVIIDLMPARNNFYIALHDKETDMLSFPYFVDEHEDSPPPEKAGRGLTEYVLRTGRPLLASPEIFQSLVSAGEVISVGPASIDWLGVPLKVNDHTFGVLVVQSYTEGSRFTGTDRDMLTFISEQVAMAIDRRRGEDALRESERLFRNVVENSHDGILIVDNTYIITYSNQQLANILGTALDEVIGQDFRRYLDDESRKLVSDYYRRRQRGENPPARYEFNIVRHSGEKRRVEIISSVLGAGTDRAQTVSQVRDITESRLIEEELHRSRELYRDLVEKADIAILIDDRQGRITYFNETFTRIFGYDGSEEEVLSFRSIVHPDDVGRVMRNHSGRMQGGRIERHNEFRGVRKDGSIIDCEVDVVPLHDHEEIFGTRTYIRDITERKANEERIQASLQEKEVMLREIHHRVKNNLQVIASLLNLQSRHIQDPQALGMFAESRRRVHSMAMVHEKLYRTENLSRVDFGEYIHSLTRRLFQMYGIKPGTIQLDIGIPDLELDINTAIPCGLILSELASNALKHAFPDGRKGVFSIRMQREEDGTIELLMRDDGVGYENMPDSAGARSFGLELVDMLVEQLRGRIETDHTNGTGYTIRFKPLSSFPKS